MDDTQAQIIAERITEKIWIYQIELWKKIEKKQFNAATPMVTQLALCETIKHELKKIRKIK